MGLEPHLTAVPRRLREALPSALADFKWIFLSAEAGWGKTAVIHELLRARPHCCAAVQPDRTPRFSSREPLVVLDDVQNLSPRLEQRVAGIFRRSPKRQRFILLSRGPLPGFLLPYQYAGELRLFQSEDLRLDPEGIALLASERGLTLPAGELLRLEAETGGYPPFVCALLDAMAAGGGLGPRERDAAVRRLDAYWDSALYASWDRRTRELLLSLSFFPEADAALAGALLEFPQGEELLSRVSRATGVLRSETGGVWRCSDLLLPYLRRKALGELSAGQIRRIHLLGGAWCDRRGDGGAAAQHYLLAGDRPALVHTLVRAVRRHEGPWDLLRLSPYLDALTEEELRSAPELAYAMYRLGGLLLDPEETARRQEGLTASAAGGGRPPAPFVRFFPDASLPRRGGEAWVCGPASFACGLPSVIRGERELSDLLLQAPDLAQAPAWNEAERALGRCGVGLGELICGEYRLETGGDVAALLLQWRPLQLRIRERGVPSSEFVCVALMVRSLCAEGQLPEAASFLLRFRQRAEAAGAAYLLPSVDAMRCRLALLEGSLYAANWFAAQPPDGDSVSLLDGYRLTAKIRCHIQREEYHTALLSLGRLLDRYVRCSRPLDMTELWILTAVCRWRMGGGDWRDHLSKALSLGRKYRYTAVFAREGAALLPLLEQMDPEYAGARYWDSVLRGVLTYAKHYPWYLEPLRRPAAPLTSTERAVLSLLLRHKTNGEIGRILEIRPGTVKTHLRNLFTKLGVHSREEARRAAIQLNLN